MSNEPRRYIVSPPYNERIVRGDVGAVSVEDVTSISPIRRFGHNGNVGATYETVWCDSSLYVYMSTASKLLVTSSSAQDAAAGTGTRTLQLTGLDGDYAKITEIITMTGAVAVTTTNKFLRLFTCKSITAGTGGINAGNITVKDANDFLTLGYMEAGEGKTQNAIFTVPADKTFIVTNMGIGEMAQKRSDFALFVRPLNKSWYIAKLQIVKNQTFDEVFDMPLKFDEKTDIEIRAKASGGSGIVVADFSGYYY